MNPVLDVPTEPFHPSVPEPPLAKQAVELLLAQERLVDWPVSSEVGVALSELMLAGGGVVVTVTVSELGTLAPPVPVQVSV